MNCQLIIFKGLETIILTKAECALRLKISIRTINRRLADGKPTRRGWFFDEVIKFDDLKPKKK